MSDKHVAALRKVHQSLVQMCANVARLSVKAQVEYICEASPYAEHLASLRSGKPPHDANDAAPDADGLEVLSDISHAADTPKSQDLAELKHAAEGHGASPAALQEFLTQYRSTLKPTAKAEAGCCGSTQGVVILGRGGLWFVLSLWGQPAAQMGCLRNRSGSPSGADQPWGGKGHVVDGRDSA